MREARGVRHDGALRGVSHDGGSAGGRREAQAAEAEPATGGRLMGIGGSGGESGLLCWVGELMFFSQRWFKAIKCTGSIF